MLRRRILFVALGALLLGTTPVRDRVAATENSNSMAEFWVPAAPPRTHYRIECRIDSVSRSLIGSEVIRFKNESSRPLSRLALDWQVSSRQMVKIVINGTPVSILADSSQPTIPSPLLFDLPPELATGKQVEITLNFNQPL
jgi:hypothetical protein